MPKSLMIFYYALMEKPILIEPRPIFTRSKKLSILFTAQTPDGELTAHYSFCDKKWRLFWENNLV